MFGTMYKEGGWISGTIYMTEVELEYKSLNPKPMKASLRVIFQHQQNWFLAVYDFGINT